MELKIDPEDLEEVLEKIQGSLGIRFEQEELAHVNTYGELSNAIKAKINRDPSLDCSSQQAFYKLREALIRSLEVETKDISPATELKEIFPLNGRRVKVQNLEEHLGFELSLLRPSHFVTSTLGALLLVFFFQLFSHLLYGLIGLILTFTGLWVSQKNGKTLVVKNLKELSKKITREHYLQSRRNPDSYNEHEIDQILEDWFVSDLGVKRSALRKDAQLFE